MLSLRVENHSEGSKASLDSGIMYHYQNSSKVKRARDQFRAWNFYFTIQSNLLGKDRVSSTFY